MSMPTPTDAAPIFRLLVAITAHSEADADAVAQALDKMRPMCLFEPGCISWDAYRSHEDPRRFWIMERWATRQDWVAHDALPSIQTVYLPEILPRVTREVHALERVAAAAPR